MKKLIFLYSLIFSNWLIFAQSTNALNSISDTLRVTFNKVQPSFDNWSTAELKICAETNSDKILLNFDVPNFNERFKTTLNDYCIIETDKKQYKLINQKESVSKKGSLNYTFSFVITKTSLTEIVDSDLKKITFYFVPNEQFVKTQLAENNFMEESLKRYLGRVAKITLKYKVSKPNEIEYNNLKSWLLKNL